MRFVLAVAIVSAMVGCHLIGGTDDLVIVDPAGPTSTNATTGGSSASSTSGSGGAAPNCTNEICAEGASDCETCECLEGIVCACNNLGVGQRCRFGYCDGGGSCVPCLDDTNYPCEDMSLNCDMQTCVAASCSDTEKNGGESDIDCGGPCAPCVNGKTCFNNADCLSALCSNLICAPCNTHEDCGTARYCENTVCHPKKGGFDSCDADYECLSNNCVCIALGCGCAP
jgi:hypothetical protein